MLGEGLGLVGQVEAVGVDGVAQGLEPMADGVGVAEGGGGAHRAAGQFVAERVDLAGLFEQQPRPVWIGVGEQRGGVGKQFDVVGSGNFAVGVDPVVFGVLGQRAAGGLDGGAEVGEALVVGGGGGGGGVV